MHRSIFRRRPFSLFVTLSFLSCLAAITARGVDLSNGEKQQLDLAKRSLTQLQSNLKFATDTAGPGDAQPTPSKAKLAQARLQSAKQSAANAAARLAKLPADNDDVKALQADYDAAVKAVAALDDRLAGKGQTAPADGPPAVGVKPVAPTPNAESPKARLGYRDAEALKIATSNINDVTADAEDLEKSATAMKAAKDPGAIAPIDLRTATARIQDARRKTGFASDQLKNLPADHPSVRTASDALAKAVARVDAAEKVIDPISKAATARTDPNSYPELKADISRLKELASTLHVSDLQSDRPAAAEAVKQLPAMKAEVGRLATKYAPLLAGNGDAAPSLRDAGAQLNYKIKEFEEALDKEKQNLPRQFESDIAEVNKLAEQAVAEKKPAFFKGGIASHLQFAQDKLELFEAIDSAAGAAARAKLQQTREAMKVSENSLSDEIIAANELPADSYTGSDKADLIRRATEVIQKQYPKAQVLAVRIPSAGWSRETKWRNQNNEWYKIDRSRVQPHVIVKRDDKLAEVRPVDLWMDHTNHDAISAAPFFAVKDTLSPGSLLLVSKVR